MKQPTGNPQINEARDKINDQISKGPLKRAKRLTWRKKRRHRSI